MTLKDLSAYHYAAEELQNKIDQRGELYMRVKRYLAKTEAPA